VKFRNICCLFAVCTLVNFTPFKASAHDYTDYHSDSFYYRGHNRQNYTNINGNDYTCDHDEYPRFSFDSRDRVRSHWMYRTDQFELATLGCRISKNSTEQIAFYQNEAANYLKFLKERRITAIWSIDGQRLDPRAIKRLYFLPQNGALIAEFEY
jgi:hypothetical protein